MPVFHHRAELDHTPADVLAWHHRPGALQRLLPPWERIRVRSAKGAVSSGGSVELGIRLGPKESAWEIEHTHNDPQLGWVDRQVQGPFRRWSHEHRFEALADGRTRVVDRVEWDPPLGTVGRALSEAPIRRTLQRAFDFRTRRLEADLGLIATYGTGAARTVAITGATGLVGAALAFQLEASGYRVLRISRSERTEEGWLRWDPAAGSLPSDALEGLFGVVHLAGESIASLRWTKRKRQAILESREGGTLLLSRTLAALKRPPEVLVSASAVGFYGHGGDAPLTEDSASGEGFLAEVCRRWEAATRGASAVGIRTVHLRSGLVLSPSGGPLAALLLPFGLGVGGRIGSGRQYISWIDLDDHTAMILHALNQPAVRGALNSTSPNPLTNGAFTDVLGRVLKRPTLLPVPAVVLASALGDMGVELLLSGQRVHPVQALGSGYRFLFPDLEDSLRHQLGRMEESDG